MEIFELEKEVDEKERYKHGFEEISRQYAQLLKENETLKSKLGMSQ